MKQIYAFVVNEFHHIIRDPRTLIILLIMPVVQILIYGFALSNEVKNSSFAVWDKANNSYSHELIEKLNGSKYFDYYGPVANDKEVERSFRTNKIKVCIVLDRNFGKDIQKGMGTPVQIIADASDPNVGTTVTNYATNIISSYLNQNLPELPYQIKPEVRYLYNPELKSSYTFVPGVMAMILMLVSTMMTGVSIVKEKETGTMEVILVSPLQPLKMIVAKMIPYFLVSFINIVNIILLSIFVLGVPVHGSIFLLLVESSLFIITCLSFGFLISTVTDTQESAMFISLIGLFLPTLMLSGYMFPIENLPLPLRTLSNAVPARWYFNILKNIMIKGLGIGSVWKENIILLTMTIGLITLSIRKFKLRLE